METRGRLEIVRKHDRNPEICFVIAHAVLVPNDESIAGVEVCQGRDMAQSCCEWGVVGHF